MVAMRGPKADTGAVIKPQPTPFGLSLGYLEPLLTPDTLHPFVVYLPHPFVAAPLSVGIHNDHTERPG